MGGREVSRVLVLVEGPTERAIIQKVLAPYMGARNAYMAARVIGKPGHKGGIRSFDATLKEILMLLSQESQAVVSTFFDYYGLPNDWPGRIEARGTANACESARILENNIFTSVSLKFDAGLNPDRFIPYIQMHELEALLFVNPQVMAQIFGQPHLETQFAKIVQECGGCETIDDNPASAPSKRIGVLFPQYKKGSGVNAHAPAIVEKTGIETIRQKCPHFNEWLDRLEHG
jgi:hypothetical protein